MWSTISPAVTRALLLSLQDLLKDFLALYA
jgi:hypothetical protein